MAVLGFIYLLSFIFLIVGLVNPSKVLRGFEKPTRLKVVLCWLVLSTVAGLIGTVIGDDEITKVAKVEDVENAEEIPNTIDTLTEDEKNIRQLKNEIKSISEGVNGSKYRETIESLQIEIVLFAAWADIITNNISSENQEIASLAKELKSKVEKVQVAEFPLIRKRYSEIVANKLWEHDVYIDVIGKSRRTLNITGGIFAANKNIKEFQENIHSLLQQFRFNQTRYRWYKGADEYDYYTIYEGKDSDLVILD